MKVEEEGDELRENEADDGSIQVVSKSDNQLRRYRRKSDPTFNREQTPYRQFSDPRFNHGHAQMQIPVHSLAPVPNGGPNRYREQSRFGESWNGYDGYSEPSAPHHIARLPQFPHGGSGLTPRDSGFERGRMQTQAHPRTQFAQGSRPNNPPPPTHRIMQYPIENNHPAPLKLRPLQPRPSISSSQAPNNRSMHGQQFHVPIPPFVYLLAEGTSGQSQSQEANRLYYARSRGLEEPRKALFLDSASRPGPNNLASRPRLQDWDALLRERSLRKRYYPDLPPFPTPSATNLPVSQPPPLFHPQPQPWRRNPPILSSPPLFLQPQPQPILPISAQSNSSKWNSLDPQYSMIHNQNSNPSSEPRQVLRPIRPSNDRDKYRDRNLPGLKDLGLLTVGQLLHPRPLPPPSSQLFPLQPPLLQPHNAAMQPLPSGSRSNAIATYGTLQNDSHPQGSSSSTHNMPDLLPGGSVENPIMVGGSPQGDLRGNEGGRTGSRWAKWAVDGEGREGGERVKSEDEDEEMTGAILLLDMKGKDRIP